VLLSPLASVAVCRGTAKGERFSRRLARSSRTLATSKVIAGHLLIGYLKIAYGAVKIPSTAQLSTSYRVHSIVLDTRSSHQKVGVHDLQAIQHF
jgi:hypothetical protein